MAGNWLERQRRDAQARRQARQDRRAARQGGSSGGGDQEAEPTMAERIPEAPSISDPTNMPRQGAEPGDPGGSLEELGADVPAAIEDAERARLAAAEEDKTRAEDFETDVKADTVDTIARIDTESMKLEEDQARIQDSIDSQAEALKEIPGEIKTEFDDLRDQLATQQGESLGRIDSKETAALGQVMEGRNSAMLAAVQGIQGNVNNQVASIQSNPNLTDSQKAGMIAQIKMSGASAMAPAIGQTVLAFNQLSADVATKFGQISGQIESTGLTVSAGLMGQQGAAYAQAKVAVGEMTNQLIQIDANSSVAFAQSQTQLLATRATAQMQSNDILLRNLPLQNTPFLDFAEAAGARLDIANQLDTKEFIMNLQEFGMELQVAYYEEEKGTPMRNFIDGLVNFVSQYGFGR